MAAVVIAAVPQQRFEFTHAVFEFADRQMRQPEDLKAWRVDDSPAAVEQRLALYDEQTAPLIAHYRRQGVLAVVDGVGSPDEVFGRLIAAIVATTGLSGPGGDGRASR